MHIDLLFRLSTIGWMALLLDNTPTITRLVKGIFNIQPPVLRYSATWDIQRVLNYLEAGGQPSTLSLKARHSGQCFCWLLHGRWGQQICLSIVWELTQMDWVAFFPVVLAKQSRQGKPIQLRSFSSSPSQVMQPYVRWTPYGFIWIRPDHCRGKKLTSLCHSSNPIKRLHQALLPDGDFGWGWDWYIHFWGPLYSWGFYFGCCQGWNNNWRYPQSSKLELRVSLPEILPKVVDKLKLLRQSCHWPE